MDVNPTSEAKGNANQDRRRGGGEKKKRASNVIAVRLVEERASRARAWYSCEQPLQVILFHNQLRRERALCHILVTWRDRNFLPAGQFL
jgi:hypothetical protein